MGRNHDFSLSGDWPQKCCDVKDMWEVGTQTSQARTFQAEEQDVQWHQIEENSVLWEKHKQFRTEEAGSGREREYCYVHKVRDTDDTFGVRMI